MIAALIASLLFAQLEVSASAEIPVSDAGVREVRVGEPFQLVISAKHPAGGVALLPEPLDLGAAFTERRASRKHERSGDASSEIDRYQLEVIAFEPGEKTLPAIPLAFGSTTASTEPLVIQVASGLDWNEQQVAASTLAEALAELEKMAAPSPNPRAIEVPDRRLLYLLAALVLWAALVLIGLFVLKNRRMRVVPAPPPPPPRPPHEVALERLQALLRSGSLEREEHKAFHVELSEALRDYVGARFGFDSIELTVSELFAELEKRSTPKLDRARLREILVLSDLVKFAKFVPDVSESRAALEAAIDLVKKTAPRAAAQEARA